MKKIFIIIASVILLTGCSYTDVIFDSYKEVYKKKENDNFSFSQDKGYADKYYFAYYIEGVVKNNTSKSYSYVQVTFNVYDDNNNVIGSCIDNINNLEGNGTWKIKAYCTGDAKSIKKYKLTGFTSW